MNITISKYDLELLCVEIFFILSFAYLTYATNIYIIWGVITFLPILFVTKQRSIFPYILMFCFFLFFCFYYTLYGIEGAFRMLKTYILCLTFIILSTDHPWSSHSYRLLKPLHYFMVLSAWIVCIDFFLFWGGLPTIMNFTNSGFIPRPCGFMEDSNFYSYLMVCYIMYLKYTFNRPTKFFIFSVFLSGSFSAIIILMLLLFFYKKTNINKISLQTKNWKIWKSIIIVSVLVAHSFYFIIVEHKDDIISYVEEIDMNPLLKVKAISMFHRFESQKIAIDEIGQSGKQLWGGGPGITRKLNDRDMNLHNTYYQIYVEIGGILVAFISLFLFHYMLKITSISFLMLFGLMSLFGNMLEVFYAPILPFIYFLYKLNYHVTIKTELSNSISCNMHR